MARLIRTGAIILYLVSAIPAVAASLVSEQLTAELIAENAVTAPGETVSVMLHQTIAPGWHTYWKNPGDSGLAPVVDWALPDGVTVTPTAWPAPHRIDYGPLVNFGYSGDTALPFDVSVPAEWPAGRPLRLTGEAEILVCEKICIPVSGKIALDIPTGTKSVRNSDAAALFATMRARRPLPSLWPASVRAGPERLRVTLRGPGTDFDAVDRAYLFPLTWGVIAPAAPQRLSIDGEGLSLTAARGEVPPPDAFSAIVTLFPKDGPSRSFLLQNAPVATGPAALPEIPAVPDRAAVPHFALLLLLAFAGGLLLNLMPCVFPVLAVKAIGLANQRAQPARSRLAHGGAYTLGVVVSFLALAGLLLALRASGEAVGWGYQLQEPLIIGALAYVAMAVGLNLSGVFEIGTGLSRLGGNLSVGSGHLGSYATGLLATLVAAPCTAPFMATAIGGALVLPPLLTLAVFTVLGLGLAFPYLALSGVPALANRMPRPGPWMERFKQLLAFPMYATVAWLIWVLSQQAGADAAFLTTLGLIAIAFAAWTLSPAPLQKPGGLRAAARAAVVGLPLVGAAGVLFWMSGIGDGLPAAQPASAVAAAAPYSAKRLAALEQAGHPVFVNMTAAWCITCKVNERVALSGQGFDDLLDRRNIVYLQGDWTNRDAEITRFLERFRRIGVPLYVFFPGGGLEPVVLPQILSPGLVDDTLSGAGTKQS